MVAGTGSMALLRTAGPYMEHGVETYGRIFR